MKKQIKVKIPKDYSLAKVTYTGGLIVVHVEKDKKLPNPLLHRFDYRSDYTLGTLLSLNVK